SSAVLTTRVRGPVPSALRLSRAPGTIGAARAMTGPSTPSQIHRAAAETGVARASTITPSAKYRFGPPVRTMSPNARAEVPAESSTADAANAIATPGHTGAGGPP